MASTFELPLCADEGPELNELVAQITPENRHEETNWNSRPIRLTERFHDAITAYANGLKITGPDEERVRDEFFNGLIDELERQGLGDPRRATAKKK